MFVSLHYTFIKKLQHLNIKLRNQTRICSFSLYSILNTTYFDNIKFAKRTQPNFAKVWRLLSSIAGRGDSFLCVKYNLSHAQIGPLKGLIYFPLPLSIPLPHDYAWIYLTIHKLLSVNRTVACLQLTFLPFNTNVKEIYSTRRPLNDKACNVGTTNVEKSIQ